MINTAQIITVTEAKRNFSKAIRIADENGFAIVLENNRPKYKLTNLEIEPDLQLTDDEKIVFWPAESWRGSNLHFWSLRNNSLKMKGLSV